MPALRNRSARRPVDMQTVMSFFEGEGSSAEEAEYTALDTTDLEAGEYVLTVTLTDRYADQRVSKSVNFMVVEPRPYPQTKKALEMNRAPSMHPPAASYSPTRSPKQYHRRKRA